MSRRFKSKDADAKAAFAYNLYQRMKAKGWNQSELARQATEHLPKPVEGQKQGRAIGRDLISNYIRGKVLPRPATLAALAKALDCKETDLLPPRSVPSAGARTRARSQTGGFTLQARSNGMANLEFRGEMSIKKAVEIVTLLNRAD